MSLVLTLFFILAAVQVYAYQVNLKAAIKHFWLLGFFYFFLFAFLQGLIIFCNRYTIHYGEAPIFVLISFVIFGRGEKFFPQFGGKRRLDFYFVSSLLAGAIWFFFLINRTKNISSDVIYLQCFVWSLFPAGTLPILAGIREELLLRDQPKGLNGLPVYLFSCGIFLMSLAFFWRFIN